MRLMRLSVLVLLARVALAGQAHATAIVNADGTVTFEQWAINTPTVANEIRVRITDGFSSMTEAVMDKELVDIGWFVLVRWSATLGPSSRTCTSTASSSMRPPSPTPLPA